MKHFGYLPEIFHSQCYTIPDIDFGGYEVYPYSRTIEPEMLLGISFSGRRVLFEHQRAMLADNQPYTPLLN